jgi:hypothetical protein
MSDRRFSFPVIEPIKAGVHVDVGPTGHVHEDGHFAIGTTAEASRGDWVLVDLIAIPYSAIASERLTAGTRTRIGSVKDGRTFVVGAYRPGENATGLTLRYTQTPMRETLILPFDFEKLSTPTLPARSGSESRATATSGTANIASTSRDDDFIAFVRLYASEKSYDLTTAQICAEQIRPDLARAYAAAGGKLLTILP